jgi:lipoate-protein ligase B
VSTRLVHWSYLGQVPYERADRLQRRLRERVRSGDGLEFLLMLEHPHVFTLGRNASPDDFRVDGEWLRSRRAEVVETDRGGKITYHGPGQLVGYPILDLSPDRRDLRRYVKDLQEMLVQTLAELGVEAEPRHRTEEIGVWVGPRKIASIGVHVSRWITTHGFALNVNTDLSYFGAIVPCGLAGVEMTSLQTLSGRQRELGEVASVAVRHFAEVFERRVRSVSPNRLLGPWPTAS